LKEAYAVRRTVPPSAEIEEQIPTGVMDRLRLSTIHAPKVRRPTQNVVMETDN
jgi:hypothetical protein